jgi:hypothetical protein
MNFKNGRLQAAVEYLSMYGWAIIIVAIAILALAALGVFNPQAYVGQQCAMGGGFSCVSYSMAENGMLFITIAQSTISPILVTGVGCYANSNDMELQAPYNPPSNEIPMQIGSSSNFSSQCYNYNGTKFGGGIGAVYEGSIAVSYINTVKEYKELGVGTLVVRVSH